MFLFCKDTATTEIYTYGHTRSRHDAVPSCLEGALRQLRERLPSEFQDLFDKLGRRHRATEQGRANIFLANLANALDPGHFDPPLEDDNWCRANRPAELVGHLSVKREWKGDRKSTRLNSSH